MVSSVTISTPLAKVNVCGSHPNELDLRRIMRMLEKRVRYRYVTVNIAPTDNGYRILSPCCSRTIAPDGQMIDIALIQFNESSSTWELFSKDHAGNAWRLYRQSGTLTPLMDCLNEDPEKTFWQ